MKKQRLIFYKSELWIIIICTLCLQMSDLKIASIKLSEVVLLLLTPFYLKQIFKSRILLLFFLFFLLFFFKTAIVNTFTKFYINDELPLLKQPYFISLSRLIEMIACLIFSLFIANAFKLVKDPYALLKKILFVQIFIFGIFYIFIYCLYAGHILSTTSYDNLIVYDASAGDMVFRLRGLYVEGGPLGLFYAFLFLVCVPFYKRLQLSPLYLALCLVVVFMANSKAGYMLVVLTGVVFLFSKVTNYIKTYTAKVTFYALIVICFIGASGGILEMYITSFTNIEETSATFAPNEIDPNFMLGRISAGVILPNMLQDSYLKGIGWGNYPLLRNNPQYRKFMPEIPVSMWDATGFGGMVDTLIEAGIPLFVLYLLIYFHTIKQIRKKIGNSGYVVLAFIGPLLLGVSIYFLYTWFLLGVIVFMLDMPSEKEEIAAGQNLDI